MILLSAPSTWRKAWRASARPRAAALTAGLGGLRFAGRRLRSGFEQSLDGESNALGLHVRAQHLHLHDLADLHDLVRVLDVAVGELADVNQSVLVHADIDECAEVGHVGDHALQNHSRLRVGDLAHAFGEAGRQELLARIAARLLQLFQICRRV